MPADAGRGQPGAISVAPLVVPHRDVSAVADAAVARRLRWRKNAKARRPQSFGRSRSGGPFPDMESVHVGQWTDFTVCSVCRRLTRAAERVQRSRL